MQRKPSEIRIGGPRFWAALAAAAGTGLTCRAAQERVLATLHLPSPDSLLVPGYVAALTYAAVWFFGSWLAIRIGYHSDPDRRSSCQLIGITFAASISATLFTGFVQILEFAVLSTVLERWLGLEVDQDVIQGVIVFALPVILVYVMPPLYLSIHSHRHGFFFAGLSTIVLADLMVYFPEDSYSLFLSGFRMAAVFGYVYGRARSQQLIAGLSIILIAGCLANCLLDWVRASLVWDFGRACSLAGSPGLLGATYPMVLRWVKKREKAADSTSQSYKRN